MDVRLTTTKTGVSQPSDPGLAVSLDGQSEPRTHLSGNRLTLARAAWALVTLLTVTMFAISLPARYNQLANHTGDVRAGITLHASDPAQLGMSPEAYGSYNLILEVLVALVFAAVAIAIFARKSDDWMALLTSLALLTFGTAAIPTMSALVEVQPVWSIPWMAVNYIAWASIGAFFFLFPDGRFVPRRMMWTFLLFAALSIPWSFLAHTRYYPENWPTTILVAVLLLLWLPPLFSQIYKYRTVLGPTQRQQAKWVVFGITVTICGGLIVTMPGLIDMTLSRPGPKRAFYELAYVPALYLCLAILPISIGISILRYRLYDIDLIINRALVYVPLTAILAGLYSASITFFQKLFVGVTREGSDAAIVLTTLALATSFTPIKNWLQAIVDRRFKEAPDPAKRLEALSAQLRASLAVLDSRKVVMCLLDEAVEGYGATGGAVYVRKEGRLEFLGSRGEWRDGITEISIPLKSGDHDVGEIRLGPRMHDRPYTPEDKETLRRAAGAVVDVIGPGGI